MGLTSTGETVQVVKCEMPEELSWRILCINNEVEGDQSGRHKIFQVHSLVAETEYKVPLAEQEGGSMPVE